MIKNSVSRRIGELRLNQAWLSRKTGIRKATIWELYNDMAKGISFAHMDAICKALNCDVSDLFEYVPDEDPQQPET